MNEPKDKNDLPKNSSSDNTRRKALKALTIGTGAVVAGHWSKPVVESVMLPAHAQTSGLGITAGGGSGAGTTGTP